MKTKRDVLHVVPSAELDGPASIPAQLRGLADEVEAGGGVRTAIVLCENLDGSTDIACYGFRPSRMHVVGLLEWVKLDYQRGPSDAPEGAA